ncbi:hypothetical protein HF078_07630 [Bacillus sp. RO2]|uniref:hypothetical protein n=1 Tax=Bacillus sp. RO2 TaxID=2723913 RepID=UPI00145DF8C1|nr:hypothetical protein [Bacillus sp. RO2]NMH72936.1 hypothetical protein [Bacillus sp. RO2]
MDGLTQIIRVTGREYYKHIVSMVMISLIMVTVLSPSFFLIKLPFSIVYVMIVMGPLFVGAAWAVQQLLLDRSTSVIKSFFQGVIRYFLPSIGYSLFLSFFVIIIAASWWHYNQAGGTFSFALACFQTYFCGMVFLSQIYTVPLVVKFEYSLKDSIFTSVKLLVKNPLYTILSFFQILSVFALLLLTVVGLFLIFPALATLFNNIVTSSVIATEENIDSWETVNI